MKREEVIKYMQCLSNVKLAELFYELVREENSKHKNLVLAEPCFSSKSSPASTSLVALTNEIQSESNSHRDEFVNFGLCNNCKSEVTSWSKSAVCPVCGETVGLT